VTLAVSNGNQQRGVRLVKRAQSPVTQLAECEAVNFEVRGSSPRRRAIGELGYVATKPLVRNPVMLDILSVP